ncbi:MAG: hypothetical protein J6P03_04835 [Opitutales bacterium]|nr:hypothetical protein [Opitutales bacterium]
MKTAKLSALILSALILAQPSFARVGEKRAELQGRILSKSGAYEYPAEEKLRESLELPYSDIFFIQGEDIKNAFFFKRFDGAAASNLDTLNQGELYGWEVHAAFKKGVSVLESYRRHGAALTFLEVKILMKKMLEGRDGVSWKAAQYVASKPAPSDEFSAELEKIVRKNSDRFVYLYPPSTVGKTSAFFSSVSYYVWEDEKRAASENYAKMVEQARRLSDARTAAGNASKAKGSTKNFSEGDVFASRKTVIKFNTANAGAFGESPVKNRTKDVWIAIKIPEQEGTMLGYNYETSDGSLRALLTNNMVVFVDAEYDKLMRGHIESIYQKQAEKREAQAEASVSSF